MKKLFTLILLSVLPLQTYSTEVTLSQESIILVQMISHPEVQKCIKKIEADYQGTFHISTIVRRPLNPEVMYEDGSAALTAHSTYFFRGSVGAPYYKGPDAVAVDLVKGYTSYSKKYTCRIVDQIYN